MNERLRNLTVGSTVIAGLVGFGVFAVGVWLFAALFENRLFH